MKVWRAGWPVGADVARPVGWRRDRDSADSDGEPIDDQVGNSRAGRLVALGVDHSHHRYRAHDVGSTAVLPRLRKRLRHHRRWRHHGGISFNRGSDTRTWKARPRKRRGNALAQASLEDRRRRYHHRQRFGRAIGWSARSSTWVLRGQSLVSASCGRLHRATTCTSTM
jgi:hypothetical protein